MVKFWKYYKYYFCTLWKRPLVWLLTGGMIYAQYEQNWQIQAMIYVGFVLLLPLAVSAERIRMDYELEDIASDLAKREARRGNGSDATVREDETDTETGTEQDQFDAYDNTGSEEISGFDGDSKNDDQRN